VRSEPDRHHLVALGKPGAKARLDDEDPHADLVVLQRDHDVGARARLLVLAGVQTPRWVRVDDRGLRVEPGEPQVLAIVGRCVLGQATPSRLAVDAEAECRLEAIGCHDRSGSG
jgi:hypothetical protein